MEKVLDSHITIDNLGKGGIHTCQFAYQPGKLTATALHHLVRKVENAIRNTDMAIGSLIA